MGQGAAKSSLLTRFRPSITGIAVTFVLLLVTVHAAIEVLDARITAKARLTEQAAAFVASASSVLDYQPGSERALDALRLSPGIDSVTLSDSARHIRNVARDSKNSVVPGPSGSWTTFTLHFHVPSALGKNGTLKVEATVWPDVLAALERSAIFAAVVSALTAALIVLLKAWQRRTLGAPVEQLTRIIRELRASGQLPATIERPRRGGLGQLGDEIVALLTDRERSDRNLRALNAHFESRVQERTQQLDAAVKDAQLAVARAESASRAKSDFLARMSHEIRTPMNGVLGMADLLQHSATLDERQRGYAVVIHQSGNALLRLINDVLDFSKIEASKLELDNNPFCVREMVEDALEIIAERAQSKGLELICDISAGLDTAVVGDALRLRQVIINLLGNAVKFTERGDIVVKATRRETDLERATFEFEVTDTGIGIDSKDYEAIFEAFAQADGSTTRRYGGTGLGLAISKQLVELMGGMIGVTSVVGKGSAFRFSVPLQVDRTAELAKPPQDLAETRIFVVEKNAAARRVLGQHMRSWGGTLTEFTTADQVLDRLETAFQGEVDLMVIDAHLPGTTAVDMVAAIRRIAVFADLPILMLHTGAGDPPAARATRGPVAWQSKPTRRAVLQKSLIRLLRGEAGVASNEVRSPATLRSEQAAVATQKLGHCAVLLVEDNPVNQEVARAMLGAVGADVDTANGGTEALAKVKTREYSVVLMDCQMPDLDGYETTRQLRRWELEEGRMRMPVVALTANALNGDAEKCFAAGMDRYLAKPFTIEQLRAVLAPFASPVVAGVAGSESAPTVLDPGAINRIRGLAASGRPGLQQRLASVYTESSVALVRRMREAARTSDGESLLRAAHELKSSSANLGALNLADLCRELEAAAHGGDLLSAVSILDLLAEEHGKVLAAIQQWDDAAPLSAETLYVAGRGK